MLYVLTVLLYVRLSNKEKTVMIKKTYIMANALFCLMCMSSNILSDSHYYNISYIMLMKKLK